MYNVTFSLGRAHFIVSAHLHVSAAYYCIERLFTFVYTCSDTQAFGFAVVEQLYGLETIRNAAEQLKAQYGSKGKMRLKLFVSVKGIKLFDAYTFVSEVLSLSP